MLLYSSGKFVDSSIYAASMSDSEDNDYNPILKNRVNEPVIALSDSIAVVGSFEFAAIRRARIIR